MFEIKVEAQFKVDYKRTMRMHPQLKSEFKAAVAELIDEAAFADVGFSSDGNLRQSDALEFPVLRHRGNKFCFFDLQFRISFWGMSGFWGMCDFFWCSGCSVAPMGATMCGKLKEQVGGRF
jgi:hypothetical protein